MDRRYVVELLLIRLKHQALNHSGRYIDIRTVTEHRSLSWHINRDTGPRFLQSRPKDCPIWLLSSIRHYIVGKNAKFMPLVCFLFWAGRDLYCAMPVVTRDLWSKGPAWITHPFMTNKGSCGPYLTRLIKLKIITIACTCTYYAMYCDFLGLLLATWLLLQL